MTKAKVWVGEGVKRGNTWKQTIDHMSIDRLGWWDITRPAAGRHLCPLSARTICFLRRPIGNGLSFPCQQRQMGRASVSSV